MKCRHKMLLFTFDIGNTSITSGIFLNQKLVRMWRMPSSPGITPSKYIKIIKKNSGRKNFADVSGVAISSVVPALDRKFNQIAKTLFKKEPFFVTHKNCGIKIHYIKPGQVGSDRIVNAAAGYKLFGGPLIIADFGTALTFDCINSKGDYLGGLIIPGIGTAAKALHEFTAKLPLVIVSKPKNLIGATTEESIKSGIYSGYIGLVKYISQILKKSLKCDKIIATGGHAGIISKELGIKVVPELTLLGLRYIWEKNNIQEELR